MREILFRGKAINRDNGYHRTNYKNGDWVYGLISRPYNEMYAVPMQMANTDGVEGIEVDYKTVGQFTGVTDKNGKKIFEGDIVQIGENEEYDFFFRIGVVEFGEGTFDGGIYRYTGFYFREKDGKIDHNTIYKPDEEWKEDLAVIGNIHDQDIGEI
jgi:uncharacterized phage protein (TIGR01671 family)